MTIKQVRTPGYNYNFNPDDGYFERWGSTLEDDPIYSPIGPEIADIEISTVCSGLNGKPCEHCYKSNTSKGNNMSLATFEKVFAKLPKNVKQIAFGIGDIDGNPDMLSIFWHCRDNGVIPNVTINGWRLTEGFAEELADVCGAVAVSHYQDNDVCYNAVKMLTDAGLKQVNIHQLVAEETYPQCMGLIRDVKSDPRISKLNAVVFLSLKKKGRGNSYHKIDTSSFDNLVRTCFELGIPFGFDSCSAHKFLNFLDNNSNYNKGDMRKFIEPCESTLFSVYINVDGIAYPCSFCEFPTPLGTNVLECDDFLQDIWYGENFGKFRKFLINCNRNCPVYEV